MSDTDPVRVKVSIFDRLFTFESGRDQTPEHIQQVAQFVDEKMREARQVHHTRSPLQAAVQASLDLVDELFRLQADYQVAESEIAQRTSRLTTSIGRVFQDIGIDSSSSAES